MSSSRTQRLAALIALVLLAPVRVVAGGAAVPDHADYDALLRKYVAGDGVRYAAWHANTADRGLLSRYVARMQTADVSALAGSKGGREAQLAFWLNLYNATTLDLVLGSYPVKSIKDLGAPKSPWERELVTVEGRKLSLNAIENDVIRPTFQDPRIHFALNCAAKSCPPLRKGAYLPDSLSRQLDEQTKSFLADERFTRFDGKTLVLSKIFEWYAKDFETAAGSTIAWVRPYVASLAALPAGAKVDVKYADYDWSLNEAR